MNRKNLNARLSPLFYNSSSNPWKIRATAFFKLIREAKCIKEALRALYPKFSNANCHKLYSAISPSILQQFTWSQWLLKALEKIL